MGTTQEPVGIVIAFAGRRTDPAGADPACFPFENVHALRDVLTSLLRSEKAAVVVASGACGGDLTMLGAAEALGIRFRIVLPFSPESFRKTSVVDRPHPEYWGPLYDRLIETAQDRGDLIDLAFEGEESAAYSAANKAIVAEAVALAAKAPPRRRLAVIALDDVPRDTTDATREFAKLAETAGFELKKISTLAPRLPEP